MRMLSKSENEKFELLKEVYAASVDESAVVVNWRTCRLVFEGVVYTYHLDTDGSIYGPGEHREYPSSDQGKFLLYLAVEKFNAFYKDMSDKRRAKKSSSRFVKKTKYKNRVKKLSSFKP